MKTSPFKYRIISTQKWNNNKQQQLTDHKTLKRAEEMLEYYNRLDKKQENTYHIQTL